MARSKRAAEASGSQARRRSPRHQSWRRRRDHSSAVAGGGAGGAEHLVALVVAVDLPGLGEMLGDAPAGGGGGAADDEVGDLFGAVEVEPFAGRLEGGHQRLGQVHVGVLAAVAGDGRPVGGELLGAGAVLAAPRSGCRGSRRRRQAGARRAGGRRVMRRGGGEEHEGVAVGLLAGVDRAGVVHRPEVAAAAPRRGGASRGSRWRGRRSRARRGGRGARRWRRRAPCGRWRGCRGRGCRRGVRRRGRGRRSRRAGCGLRSKRVKRSSARAASQARWAGRADQLPRAASGAAAWRIFPGSVRGVGPALPLPAARARCGASARGRG